jgi:hypothetical protein
MNIYDHNGCVAIPVGVTQEWLDALDREGIEKNLQKILIEKAEHLGEQEKARQRLESAQEARENRQDSILRSLTEAEINEAALLVLDHTKGVLKTALRLQALIDKHIENPEDGSKRGNVNTVLDYVRAHINMLEGVSLSKKPLQDLRYIRTAKAANACGISHKNLSMIWKCLISIHKSGTALPIGQEAKLADLAATMQLQADYDREAEKEAEASLGPRDKERRRRAAHAEARRAMFPDLSLYPGDEPISSKYRRSREFEAE